MPLKVNIHLDSGFGGKQLSGFWIARKDKINPQQITYTYQVSADIHPWKTLTEFNFERGKANACSISFTSVIPGRI